MDQVPENSALFPLTLDFPRQNSNKLNWNLASLSSLSSLSFTAT